MLIFDRQAAAEISRLLVRLDANTIPTSIGVYGLLTRLTEFAYTDSEIGNMSLYLLHEFLKETGLQDYEVIELLKSQEDTTMRIREIAVRAGWLQHDPG